MLSLAVFLPIVCGLLLLLLGRRVSHRARQVLVETVTVVTSKDDGNDKIHVVPQINFGSGQLDQPNALVFDGFGKILDFTVAGLYK